MEQTWGEGPRERRGMEGGESKGKGGRRIANKGGQTRGKLSHNNYYGVYRNTRNQPPNLQLQSRSELNL